MLHFWLRKKFTAETKPSQALKNAGAANHFPMRVRGSAGYARISVLAVAAAAFSPGCHAQINCPWLNVATASGALGAPTALTLNKISDSSTTCIFRPQSGSSAESLSISVTSVDPQNAEQALKDSERQCNGAATPLKAIGNDAVMCVETAGASHTEQVIGRVRDNIFIIAINLQTSHNGNMPTDSLSGKTRAIAEQVAGNLF